MITERSRDTYSTPAAMSPGANVIAANTGNSYIADFGATPQIACMVDVQNTSGGTLGSITITLNNRLITSNSVILVQLESNSHSASSVQYIAQIVSATKGAGTVNIVIHRATPSGSASFVNNEGFRLNIHIVN